MKNGYTTYFVPVTNIDVVKLLTWETTLKKVGHHRDLVDIFGLNAMSILGSEF